MKSIRIERQDAIIEIMTRRARLNITTPRPKMNLRTTPGKMNIVRRTPQLRTNWQKVMHAPQMRIHAPRRVEFTPVEPLVIDGGFDPNGQGINVTLSLAARIRASNMSAPRSNGPTPMEQAQNVRTAALEWDMGGMEINWELSHVDINWELSQPQVEFEPHSIEIRMKQYPKLTISINPDVETRVVGRRLDKRV